MSIALKSLEKVFQTREKKRGGYTKISPHRAPISGEWIQSHLKK